MQLFFPPLFGFFMLSKEEKCSTEAATEEVKFISHKIFRKVQQKNCPLKNSTILPDHCLSFK
jgi:hypothetical protein